MKRNRTLALAVALFAVSAGIAFAEGGSTDKSKQTKKKAAKKTSSTKNPNTKGSQKSGNKEDGYVKQ
jgi:hypothetical protein